MRNNCSTPDRPAIVAGFAIEAFDQPAERRPWFHPLHLDKRRRPPRCLGVVLKPTAHSVGCFIATTYALHPAAYYITITRRRFW
jgi:hypothetical protein